MDMSMTAILVRVNIVCIIPPRRHKRREWHGQNEPYTPYERTNKFRSNNLLIEGKCDIGTSCGEKQDERERYTDIRKGKRIDE